MEPRTWIPAVALLCLDVTCVAFVRLTGGDIGRTVVAGHTFLVAGNAGARSPVEAHHFRKEFLCVPDIPAWLEKNGASFLRQWRKKFAGSKVISNDFGMLDVLVAPRTSPNIFKELQSPDNPKLLRRVLTILPAYPHEEYPAFWHANRLLTLHDTSPPRFVCHREVSSASDRSAEKQVCLRLSLRHLRLIEISWQDLTEVRRHSTEGLLVDHVHVTERLDKKFIRQTKVKDQQKVIPKAARFAG